MQHSDQRAPCLGKLSNACTALVLFLCLELLVIGVIDVYVPQAWASTETDDFSRLFEAGSQAVPELWLELHGREDVHPRRTTGVVLEKTDSPRDNGAEVFSGYCSPKLKNIR